MRVAILGGTGSLGEGLALRIARDTDHTVTVGSRDSEKADAAAARYRAKLDRGSSSISGAPNRDAAAQADVVVLSVPAKYARTTLEACHEDLTAGTTVVTPAVPIVSESEGYRHNPPRTAPSLTALIHRSAPERVDVVGAFHALPAERVATLDDPLDFDVPVVGDDEAARDRVAALTDAIDGLRSLDAGPLGNAALVESLTPLLVTLSKRNDRRDLGPRFH